MAILSPLLVEQTPSVFVLATALGEPLLAAHLAGIEGAQMRSMYLHDLMLGSIDKGGFDRYGYVYSYLVIKARQDEVMDLEPTRGEAEDDESYKARMTRANHQARVQCGFEAKWLLQFIPRKEKHFKILVRFLLKLMASGWQVADGHAAHRFISEFVQLIVHQSVDAHLVMDAMREVASRASVETIVLSMEHVYFFVDDERYADLKPLRELHRILGHALVNALEPAKLQELADKAVEKK